MVTKNTILGLLDNSGAQLCKCIHVYKTISVQPGDIFRSTIVKIWPKSAAITKVKKGEIHAAINLRRKVEKKLNTGFIIKYFDNSAIITKKKTIKPKLKGIIPLEFAKRYTNKLFRKQINLG